jgi:hypothetical protein
VLKKFKKWKICWFSIKTIITSKGCELGISLIITNIVIESIKHN